MAKYNLNMSVNHCLNWGFWEAIREILQNGDDEQLENPENKFEVCYLPEKEKLILKNKKSILEKESLLIGYSTKRDNEKTTGKYGEGYKVSLAVLMRLGKKVVIKNYHKKEKWSVLVDNEIVKVDITKFIFKSAPDNNLTWEISGVTKEEWDSIQDCYLPFIDDLELTKTTRGSLIRNERLKGNIYINNLFIENVDKLNYAYSFPSENVSLDRDRKTLKMFDLQYQTGLIMSEINNNRYDDKQSSELFSLISAGAPEVEYISGMLSSKSIESVANNFVRENKPNAYPVVSQDEYKWVEQKFKKLTPIVVSKTLKSVMVNNENYKTPLNLMESLNIIDSSGEALSPNDVLTDFYLKNKSVMTMKVLMELEEIIEMSKDWKNSDQELVADDDKMESVEME